MAELWGLKYSGGGDHSELASWSKSSVLLICIEDVSEIGIKAAPEELLSNQRDAQNSFKASYDADGKAFPTSYKGGEGEPIHTKFFSKVRRGVVMRCDDITSSGEAVTAKFLVLLVPSVEDETALLVIQPQASRILEAEVPIRKLIRVSYYGCLCSCCSGATSSCLCCGCSSHYVNQK